MIMVHDNGKEMIKCSFGKEEREKQNPIEIKTKILLGF
jgi:hypothetical protein